MEIFGIRVNAVSKLTHVQSMGLVRKGKLISRDNQAGVLEDADLR